MTLRSILFPLLGRNILYGTLTGIVLGAISGTFFGTAISFALSPSAFISDIPANLTKIVLFGFFLGGTIGACLGALYGLVAGTLSGIVTAAITLILFYPLTKPQPYAFIIRATTIVTGISAGIWIVPLILHNLFLTDSPGQLPDDLIILLIYGLISGFAALWSSGRITRWYIRQFQPRPLPPEHDTLQPS